MEIVEYYIHPQVLKVAELYKLDLFNIETYIFDDIHENQEYLQSLDPRDWRDQDHYSVLRLKKVRHNASQELIKQAYRKQLLDHHPDKGKKRLKICDDENNDYFTCITKAFDLLKENASRISYDSVDPEFDDSVPTQKDAKESFYKSFGPAFQRNSRWSKIQPVPQLGDEKTDINEVHRFYNFWDDFRSWREFSYLEESKLNSDNRDERRYIDKLNKAERKKKSIEEWKRINSMVEMAKLNDQRIIKYNIQRKAEKEAEKKAKADRKLEIRLAAEKIAKEEKEKIDLEEAERQQKLKDETNELKKQKEAMKNRSKIEKRKLRKLVETYNYFGEVLSKFNDNTKSIDMRKAEIMHIVDSLCLKMSVDDLATLNEELERATEEEMVSIITFAEEKVTGKASEMLKQTNHKLSVGNPDVVVALNRCGDTEWTFELSQFLIKAINSHPPGTKHRWHTIAEYINHHNPGLNVKEKQIIQRAKLLKSDDSAMKKEAATHNLTIKADQTAVENLKNVKITDRVEVVEVRLPWTMDEQKLLEIALKTVPATHPTRWDRISECVVTRSKKECILRFKECAEKMKAKKAAQ